MTVVDVLDVVRDPAMIDEPAVAAAADAGAGALRRRDAAVRQALPRVPVRALVTEADAGIRQLARHRANREPESPAAAAVPATGPR